MFGVMDTMFPIFFIVVFVMVIFVFMFAIGSKVKESVHNNSSPQLTVDAKVVSKRSHVWGDHSHTDYYATFEFQSNDRLELSLSGSETGMIVEGDTGKLTFQGTKFISFTRS